jgi:hypothetical protein
LQAARKLQSREQQYKDEARDAKRKLIDAENMEEPGSRKKKKKQDLPPTDAETEEISRIAKAFTVTRLFWLWNDKQTFSIAVDEQYNNLQRFESDNDKMQGQIAEIRDVLPARYHVFMADQKAIWLSQTVSF